VELSLDGNQNLTCCFSFETVDDARNARKSQYFYNNYQVVLEAPRAKIPRPDQLPPYAQANYLNPPQDMYYPHKAMHDTRSSFSQPHRQSMGKKKNFVPHERKNTGGFTQRRGREYSNHDNNNFRGSFGENEPRNQKHGNKNKKRSSVNAETGKIQPRVNPNPNRPPTESTSQPTKPNG